MKDNERQVTVWSKSRLNPYWLIERSYPLRYALTLGLCSEPGQSSEIDGRFYAWFEFGDDPNHRSKSIVPNDVVPNTSF